MNRMRRYLLEYRRHSTTGTPGWFFMFAPEWDDPDWSPWTNRDIILVVQEELQECGWMKIDFDILERDFWRFIVPINFESVRLDDPTEIIIRYVQLKVDFLRRSKIADGRKPELLERRMGTIHEQAVFIADKSELLNSLREFKGNKAWRIGTCR